MIGNTFMLHAVDRFLVLVVEVLLSLLKRSENTILAFAQEIGATVGSLEFDTFVTEFTVLFSLRREYDKSQRKREIMHIQTNIKENVHPCCRLIFSFLL